MTFLEPIRLWLLLGAAALLAVSGPATPSGAPLPKRSGCLARFFSMA